MDESQKSYANEVQEPQGNENSDRTVTFVEDEKEVADRSSRSSSRQSSAEVPVTFPTHQYSKDELMKIGRTTTAKTWPDFLDRAFTKSTGMWDPEKWFKSKRRSESPQVDDLRSKREHPAEFERGEGMGSFKRRTPDPKERIKEEKADIVLSPQRRSFGTGCHVAQTFSHRPGSPLDSRESDSIHREPSRRIGSGRIVRDPRDWEKDHKDYGYGRNRYEREEKENRFGSGGRYRNNERRLSRGRSDDRIEEEEEPEWFSSGPTSQSETIELVGFEDEKKKGVDRPIRRTKDYFSRNKIPEESPKETESAVVEENVPKPEPSDESSQEADSASQDFDVNEIFNFKMDWFLPNGTPPETNNNQGLGGSRFSQWFNRNDSPSSKMMGLQPIFDSQMLVTGLGNETASPQHHRHPTDVGLFGPVDGEKNIMEILQNANMGVSSQAMHDSHLKEQAMSGNVKCVEELEANLKMLVLGNKKSTFDGDKSAFSKLVSHLTDSHHSPSPPSSLSMGPLDKSKALQEEDLIQNMYMDNGPSPPPAMPMPDVRISPTPTPPSRSSGTTLMDLLTGSDKPTIVSRDNRGMMNNQMQGQQQNTLADLMRTWSGGQASHHGGDLLNRMPSRVSPRLLAENDARSNLTAMLQQRDLLASMAKDQLLRPTPSPDPLVIPHLSPQQSPLPPEATTIPTRIPSPLVFGQQPPVLSHAPSPIHPTHGNTLQVQNSAVLPRVPSPQELAAHTQTILHNALIKRKLEEQKENFRKRQEAQRSRSPNPPAASVPKNNLPVSPSKAINSSLVAFTPTSVMRKMHSDKFDKDSIIRTDAPLTIGNRTNKIHGSPDQKISGELSNGGLNLMNLDTSPSRPVPRALHGQGPMQRQVPVAPPSATVHGRPIVKGNVAADQNRPAKSAPQLSHNKQFPVPNQQAPHLRPDMDSVVRLVEQQHRLLNQQQAALAAQRTLSASPMPPMNAGGFSLGPRPHPNLIRPGLSPTANNNLNLPLLRSMVQANFSNPALRAQAAPLNQLTQLSQLAALQQQQQQQQQNRGAPLDPRQLRNMHPLALQQLLQASGMLPLNNNVAAMTGANRMDSGFGGAQGLKTLMPPQHSTNRQSPVNLARWFGNDVLKQKMPDMPPVPHQKALLVEEVERQQQQSTTVHN